MSPRKCLRLSSDGSVACYLLCVAKKTTPMVVGVVCYVGFDRILLL